MLRWNSSKIDDQGCYDGIASCRIGIVGILSSSRMGSRNLLSSNLNIPVLTLCVPVQYLGNGLYLAKKKTNIS